MKLLVSACLLGVLCRYDGKAKTHEGVCSLLEKHTMIPFARRSMVGCPHPGRHLNGWGSVWWQKRAGM